MAAQQAQGQRNELGKRQFNDNSHEGLPGVKGKQASLYAQGSALTSYITSACCSSMPKPFISTHAFRNTFWAQAQAEPAV